MQTLYQRNKNLHMGFSARYWGRILAAKMQIKSTETERVYVTGGGGPYLFIAIPMMVIGAYLFYIAISSLLKKNEPFTTVIIFLIIGSVFMLFGSLLFLYRAGVTLDRVRGTASLWRKMFRTKTAAVHNLNEFNVIELYIHRSAKRTGYVVQLVGTTKKIVLCDFLKLEASKACANDASTFLSLPVKDKIMD
jgi:hypothetical protein